MPADSGACLSVLEQSILDFERTVWRRAAAKDDAIRQRFGISPAAYYVTLGRIIETEAAMTRDPLLVQRLRRKIDLRLAGTAQGR